MTRPLTLMAALLIGLLPMRANARNCDSAQSQAQINQCVGAEYTAADAALNRAYREAMARQRSEAARARLRDEERRWIRQRDATCHREAAEYEGGSLQPAVATECLTRETIKRRRQLQAR